MRYFIGIDLPANIKLSIDDWRLKSWRQSKQLGEVPAANFHITLAFLGHLDPGQYEGLIDRLSSLRNDTFKVQLDQFNVWEKPPIAWLGISNIPKALTALNEQVSSQARMEGVQLQEREYVPHVTLARKCKGLVSTPILPPSFEIKVENFCLFESVSTHSGVQYPIRQEWSLY